MLQLLAPCSPCSLLATSRAFLRPALTGPTCEPSRGKAIFPVIVADKIASLPLAACVSFTAIFLLFSLNEVARDLESPFQVSVTASNCDRHKCNRRARQPLCRLTCDRFKCSSRPLQSELGWSLGANRLDAPALQVLFNQRVLATASASVGTLSWEPQSAAAGGGGRDGGGRAAPEFRRMLTTDGLSARHEEPYEEEHLATLAEVEVSIVGNGNGSKQ